MIFVDTNYFLRFLFKDDDQHQEAKNLFIKAAKDELKLITSTIVIFEIYWVLTSFYRQDKRNVLKTLFDILQMNFILEDRELLLQALNKFLKTNLDLEDCYNLYFAKSRNVREFKTFDKKLNKNFNLL